MNFIIQLIVGGLILESVVNFFFKGSFFFVDLSKVKYVLNGLIWKDREVFVDGCFVDDGVDNWK